MNKYILYINIIFLLGCQSLIEKSAPLEGDYYIQDGWLAFSSKKFIEADKHFRTAIETNDSGSIFHFLSLVGLGWTNIYQAQAIQEISDYGFILNSGNHFNAAYDILLNIEEDYISTELNNDLLEGKANLYAGLTIQRTYYAKQKAAYGMNWETFNYDLSDTIRFLYQESIDFSELLSSDFQFQYDLKLSYNDILIVRIENYIILGDFDKAILSFKEIDINQLEFELIDDCTNNLNQNNLVECLCLVLNTGSCPLGD